MSIHCPWVLMAPGQVPSANSTLRLFCFPHAGSGAWIYQSWHTYLPENIEVMPVELPGRNTRTKEQPHRHVAELVQALVTALQPLLQEKPFAFFGHSMGAWIAFELTRELQRQGLPLPLKLYASANRSPTLAGVEHDVDPVAMHRLPGPQFWEHFEVRYGANPDLADRRLRQFLERCLRADFEMIETYPVPAPGYRLPCPVLAIAGDQDCRYRRDQVEAWRDVAPVGDFKLKVVQGGHDFVTSNSVELLVIIKADLQDLVAPIYTAAGTCALFGMVGAEGGCCAACTTELAGERVGGAGVGSEAAEGKEVGALGDAGLSLQDALPSTARTRAADGGCLQGDTGTAGTARGVASEPSSGPSMEMADAHISGETGTAGAAGEYDSEPSSARRPTGQGHCWEHASAAGTAGECDSASSSAPDREGHSGGRASTASAGGGGDRDTPLPLSTHPLTSLPPSPRQPSQQPSPDPAAAGVSGGYPATVAVLDEEDASQQARMQGGGSSSREGSLKELPVTPGVHVEAAAPPHVDLMARVELGTAAEGRADTDMNEMAAGQAKGGDAGGTPPGWRQLTACCSLEWCWGH